MKIVEIERDLKTRYKIATLAANSMIFIINNKTTPNNEKIRKSIASVRFFGTQMKLNQVRCECIAKELKLCRNIFDQIVVTKKIRVHKITIK